MISSFSSARRVIRSFFYGLTGGVFLLAPGQLSASQDHGSAAMAAWSVPSPESFLGIIPPPPAVNSAETRREIRKILRIQSAADPMRIASARWTYEFSVFTFSLALGPDFKAERYPETARFFGKLNSLVQTVNDGLKDHFKSPHPFQVDARVRRFVRAVPGYDYPSYHAARCAVFRRVLALLDPPRTVAFREVAERVEGDRIFAGEHFPYSIRAGREVGEAIFAHLVSNPRFLGELQHLIEKEWSRPPDARNSFTEDG